MSDNALEQLPVLELDRKCMRCGSTEWASANHKNGKITDCASCPDAHVWRKSVFPNVCEFCGADGFDQTLNAICPGRQA